jgi:cytoskeleton protein RodZ
MSETDLQPAPEQNESEQEASLNAASVMLLEARTLAGFTQKEVADQLFLKTSFIRYIDEGQFEKLPKPAFVKGYLRSYARVVELSGDEVVAVFEASQISTQADVGIKNVTDEPMGSSTYTGPVFLSGAVGFVGVIIVIILVWLFSGPDEVATDAVVSPDTISSTNFNDVESEALQLPSRTVATRFADGTSDAAGTGGVSVTDEILRSSELSTSQFDQPIDEVGLFDEAVEEPVDEEMTATFSSISVTPEEIAEDERAQAESAADESAEIDELEVAELVEEAEEAEAVEVRPSAIKRGRVTEAGRDITTVTAEGSDVLFFEFSGNCWVEVEDADGMALYKDLNRNGDAIRITGAAPFSILLGKAPAVSLLFNGNTVDIERYTTADDTAKVRLTR